MLIETMYNCMMGDVNLYQLENGMVYTTYEFQEDNETLKRAFTSYEQAIEYLYRMGFRF